MRVTITVERDGEKITYEAVAEPCSSTSDKPCKRCADAGWED